MASIDSHLGGKPLAMSVRELLDMKVDGRRSIQHRGVIYSRAEMREWIKRRNEAANQHSSLSASRLLKT